MEKINIKDLNLTVKSVEHKMFNQDCLYEAVKHLIEKRINHCKEHLDLAISENRAFQRDSQYIAYVSSITKKEHGHFSIPVYNHMVEWLNNESSTYDKCIIQQALRQLYYTNLTSPYRTLFKILNKYNQTHWDLFNVLTEMIVVL